MKPTVLFVCVHNAGRSQMAAALLQRYAGKSVEVLSAGSEPGEDVNPAVVHAMQELGIDISQEKPKLLSDTTVHAADFVITMGCGDACPIYPGKKYLDWAVADPAGKTVGEIRPICEKIDSLIRTFISENHLDS